jgi:aryl-alcohol dehydrogenase-like predicted oxidoreductase
MLPIALGTAQLGMHYGIANASGKPSFELAREIVRSAWESGIRWFDSAQAYGDSESILGRSLSQLGICDSARVVTKLHPTLHPADGPRIRDSILHSVQQLQVQRISALLLHKEEWLDDLSGPLGEILLQLREEGFVDLVGVSVYSPERAFQALTLPEINAIQIPSSVFDRRFSRSGFFAKAHRASKLVFVRSIFLQGLIFLERINNRTEFEIGHNGLRAFQEHCRSIGAAPLEFAINYAKQIFQPSILVIGAERNDQLSESVMAYRNAAAITDDIDSWDRKWPFDDEMLVNPAKWPLN